MLEHLNSLPPPELSVKFKVTRSTFIHRSTEKAHFTNLKMHLPLFAITGLLIPLATSVPLNVDIHITDDIHAGASPVRSNESQRFKC